MDDEGRDDCLCGLLSFEIYYAASIEKTIGRMKDVVLRKVWTQDSFYWHRATAVMVSRVDDPKTGYLAFKGSHYYYDWLADAAILPRPQIPGADHCWFHYGFWKTCTSMSQDACDTAAQFGIERLVVTGHSLGGALAGTFALLHPEIAAKVISFGAPKYIFHDEAAIVDEQTIADWPFKRERDAPKLRHFVYERDPVPRLLGKHVSVEALGTFYVISCISPVVQYVRGYLALGAQVRIRHDGSRARFDEAASHIGSLWDILYYIRHHSVDRYANVICGPEHRQSLFEHGPAMERAGEGEEEEEEGAAEGGGEGAAGGEEAGAGMIVRGTTPAEDRREAMIRKMLPHIHYYEISSEECQTFDAADCSGRRGCEWVDAALEEFGVCRRRPSGGEAAAMKLLGRLIERSSRIMGYLPTPEDMSRLAATTLSSDVVPPHTKDIIARQRAIGANFLRFFVDLALDRPEWATTDHAALLARPHRAEKSGAVVATGGSAGDVLERKPSADAHPSGPFAASPRRVFPGDVVALGLVDEGEDPGAAFADPRRRKYVTFRSIVFLGRLSIDNVRAVVGPALWDDETWRSPSGTHCDVGLMAEGETEHAARAFIEKASHTARGGDVYFELGHVRIVEMGRHLERAAYVEVSAHTRDLIGVYAMGLSGIGLYTFQLQRSSSSHFANYVATGRWVDPNADMHKNAFRYRVPADEIMFDPTRYGATTTSRPPPPGVRIAPPGFRIGGGGALCTAQTPVRCMAKDSQIVYHKMVELMVDMKLNKERRRILGSEREAMQKKIAGLTAREASSDGLKAAYADLSAHISADIDGIDRIVAECDRRLEALVPTVLAELGGLVSLRSNRRFFCWDRAALTDHLRAQIAAGQRPHDPVTLNPICPEHLQTIFGPPREDVEGVQRGGAPGKGRAAEEARAAVEAYDMEAGLRAQLARDLAAMGSSFEIPDVLKI
jgi:pimeloyl-ACP methyl ester carboxylesterase